MKSINLRLEESMLEEIKHISQLYHRNVSDLIREGISKVIEEKKNDIYYKLTNFPECSQEETDEILSELNKLTSDDLIIVKTERIKL